MSEPIFRLGARLSKGLKSKRGERLARMAHDRHWQLYPGGCNLYHWQWLALWAEAKRAKMSVSSIIRECIQSRFEPPLDELNENGEI